jgi:hypothetical protein
VTGDTGSRLDFEDTFCGRLAPGEPVGNAALRTQPETPRQRGLATDSLAGIKEGLLGHAPINARCANPVNANCGNTLGHSSRMGRSTQSQGSEFWQRLVEAWGEAGLPTSQNGIAKELGMDGNGVTGRWYRGETIPPPAQLIKLAKRGKVTVDWLLTGDPPRSRAIPGTPLYALLTAWDGTADQGRTHVIESAQGQLVRHPRLPPPESRKAKSG